MGVILVRVGPSRKLEVLLVHKRYTYAFADFIHGKYRSCRDWKRPIAALLETMTAEERHDVWTLDFPQMWYRVWLSREEGPLFKQKYPLFQRVQGEALQQLARQSRGRGALLWEIPKGHRNQGEGELTCAVREMQEETGVSKGDYRFIPGARHCISFQSAGTRYVNVYFVAIATPHMTAARKWAGYCDVSRMREVDETRWCDLEQVRLLAGPENHLGTIVAPAIRDARLYLSGRWGCQRGIPSGGPPFGCQRGIPSGGPPFGCQRGIPSGIPSGGPPFGVPRICPHTNKKNLFDPDCPKNWACTTD